MLGKPDVHIQKIKTHLLKLGMKISSKWSKDLNVSSGTVILIEEKCQGDVSKLESKDPSPWCRCLLQDDLVPTKRVLGVSPLPSELYRETHLSMTRKMLGMRGTTQQEW